MFALSIPLTADNLDTIKSDLTRNLPNVKSSHRCEAIGRGLGFKSYAAARAACGSSLTPHVQVGGREFGAYLSSHAFEVSPRHFYLVAAKAALRDVVAKTPRLTMWGMGIGRPQRKEDGKWENAKEHYAREVKARNELLSDGAEPFLLSLALLARVARTKTIRSGIGSYGIKHTAENYRCTYPEGEKLGPHYVANGALIAAAIHAGFMYKIYYDNRGYLDLNVSFNMSKRSLKDLDCEIRPDGARAQDRQRRTELRRLGFRFA